LQTISFYIGDVGTGSHSYARFTLEAIVDRSSLKLAERHLESGGSRISSVAGGARRWPHGRVRSQRAMALARVTGTQSR
jgi:hypothetical protein